MKKFSLRIRGSARGGSNRSIQGHFKGVVYGNSMFSSVLKG